MASANATAARPPTRPDDLVGARGISMTYPGGVQALHEVDIGFPRGQLTTLLGPSGCGKTTLLKIVAGLIEPSSGEILIGGRPVRGPGPERAFVFQDFALMPWRRCFETSPSASSCAGCPRPSAKPPRAAASPKYVSPVSRTAIRINSPAACSNAPDSPARWRSIQLFY